MLANLSRRIQVGKVLQNLLFKLWVMIPCGSLLMGVMKISATAKHATIKNQFKVRCVTDPRWFWQSVPELHCATSLKPWFWTHNPRTLHCTGCHTVPRHRTSPWHTSAETRDHCMHSIAVSDCCTYSFRLLEKHNGFTMENKDFQYFSAVIPQLVSILWVYFWIGLCSSACFKYCCPRAGQRAQSGECLPCVYEVLVRSPAPYTQAWWLMLLIPAVERQQQEGQEFKVIRPWLHREASLGYETLSQKANKQQTNKTFAGLEFIRWLQEFWLGVRTEFPVLCGMALKILLTFYTIYLCDIAFSALL